MSSTLVPCKVSGIQSILNECSYHLFKMVFWLIQNTLYMIKVVVPEINSVCGIFMVFCSFENASTVEVIVTAR